MKKFFKDNLMDLYNPDYDNCSSYGEKEKEKNVFIICSVRGASEEYKQRLEAYVVKLETQGIKVHLPHRDTNQNATGLSICTQNMNAIKKANEVHIFYCSSSQGTHFDMGVAFAFEKKIVVVENESYGEGKSYPRMLVEWQSNL